MGDGLGDHGLAVAGRAVQQHALGRLEIVPFVQAAQLHGVPDAFDLAVKPADVGEGDIGNLLQHQVGIVLVRQQFQGEPARRVDDDALPVGERLVRQRSRAPDHAGVAASIRDDQTPVIKHLADRADRAEHVRAALLDQYHVLVEQHAGAGRQPGRVDVGGHRHDQPSAARQDLGRRMLDTELVGHRRVDLDHRPEGLRGLGHLRQLRLRLGEFLARARQRLRERMVLGHQLVIGGRQLTCDVLPYLLHVLSCRGAFGTRARR